MVTNLRMKSKDRYPEKLGKQKKYKGIVRNKRGIGSLEYKNGKVEEIKKWDRKKNNIRKKELRDTRN